MNWLAVVLSNFVPYVFPLAVGIIWGRHLGWRRNFGLMLAACSRGLVACKDSRINA